MGLVPWVNDRIVRWVETGMPRLYKQIWRVFLRVEK